MIGDILNGDARRFIRFKIKEGRKLGSLIEGLQIMNIWDIREHIRDYEVKVGWFSLLIL